MGQGQTSHSRSHTGRRPNRITGRELVSACTLALALGMLIWLKLRLVANVPRTAYAQPTQQVEKRPAQQAGVPAAPTAPTAPAPSDR
jgi:hypothetical protein